VSSQNHRLKNRFRALKNRADWLSAKVAQCAVEGREANYFRLELLALEWAMDLAIEKHKFLKDME
jgi:hypothetical protein